MIPKTKWRQILLERRKAISPQRREEAALRAKEALCNKGTILSFSPFGSEINLKPLNEVLSAKNRLFLVPYKIEALEHVPLHEIDCILVPGLGFDRENYRLGYGKGFYDQFLVHAKQIPTIGVGFKEQFCEELLPRDPWDIPVDELLLV